MKINEKISDIQHKTDKLTNLKNLLIDFYNYDDVILIIGNHKIEIKYEDFIEGYEEFNIILRDYVSKELDLQ